MHESLLNDVKVSLDRASNDGEASSISGWCFSYSKSPIKEIRLNQNNKTFPGEHGFVRGDVQKHYGTIMATDKQSLEAIDVVRSSMLHSGFSIKINEKIKPSGDINIEVLKTGSSQWEKNYKIEEGVKGGLLQEGEGEDKREDEGEGGGEGVLKISSTLNTDVVIIDNVYEDPDAVKRRARARLRHLLPRVDRRRAHRGRPPRDARLDARPRQVRRPVLRRKVHHEGAVAAVHALPGAGEAPELRAVVGADQPEARRRAAAGDGRDHAVAAERRLVRALVVVRVVVHALQLLHARRRARRVRQRHERHERERERPHRAAPRPRRVWRRISRKRWRALAGKVWRRGTDVDGIGRWSYSSTGRWWMVLAAGALSVWTRRNGAVIIPFVASSDTAGTRVQRSCRATQTGLTVSCRGRGRRRSARGQRSARGADDGILPDIQIVPRAESPTKYPSREVGLVGGLDLGSHL